MTPTKQMLTQSKIRELPFSFLPMPRVFSSQLIGKEVSKHTLNCRIWVSAPKLHKFVDLKKQKEANQVQYSNTKSFSHT